MLSCANKFVSKNGQEIPSCSFDSPDIGVCYSGFTMKGSLFSLLLLARLMVVRPIYPLINHRVSTYFLRNLLMLGFGSLALVACGPDSDLLAIEMFDIHKDLVVMTSYHFPVKPVSEEDAKTSGACIRVKELVHETFKFPFKGSPQSLVRSAAMSLDLACEENRLILQRLFTQTENALTLYRDAFPDRTDSDLLDQILPHSLKDMEENWGTLSYEFAMHLENACESLKAYDTVEQPAKSVWSPDCHIDRHW
jgi:hypothetical protein